MPKEVKMAAAMATKGKTATGLKHETGTQWPKVNQQGKVTKAPEVVPEIFTQDAADWIVNMHAIPAEGWYQCLCRNEADGTIGILIMFYEGFNGVFRRPPGEDTPTELSVIAFLPVISTTLQAELVESFDRQKQKWNDDWYASQEKKGTTP